MAKKLKIKTPSWRRKTLQGHEKRQDTPHALGEAPPFGHQALRIVMRPASECVTQVNKGRCGKTCE